MNEMISLMIGVTLIITSIGINIVVGTNLSNSHTTKRYEHCLAKASPADCTYVLQGVRP